FNFDVDSFSLLSFPTRRSSDLDYYRDIFKAKGYFRIFAVFLLFIAVLFLYFSDLNQNWVFYTSLGIIGALVLLEYIFQLRRNGLDRKSTRLNSSHVKISYAVFC